MAPGMQQHAGSGGGGGGDGSSGHASTHPPSSEGGEGEPLEAGGAPDAESPAQARTRQTEEYYKGGGAEAEAEEEAEAAAAAGCPAFASMDEARLGAMIQAQGVWDATMAWKIGRHYLLEQQQLRAQHQAQQVAPQAGGRGGLLVHINGSFHSRSRLGIVERLLDYCSEQQAGVGGLQRAVAIAPPKVVVVTMASWAADAARSELPSALSGACDFVVTTDGSVAPSFEIRQ
jgi:hypothetical protein